MSRISVELYEQMIARAEGAEAEVEWLTAALEQIAKLDPGKDSTEGCNEWGEADCFTQAQKIARESLGLKLVWDAEGSHLEKKP
jgi:hypothetical protein